MCTGTLLSDSIASNTPYFFTANHCMTSQEAAGNLFTYWFFDAVACTSPRSLAVPAYKTLAGGAMLLGRSVDSDWALVRLNAAPPAGAVFSAWRAEPLAASNAVSILHHPEGDLTKAMLERLAKTEGLELARSWSRNTWIGLCLVGACAGAVVAIPGRAYRYQPATSNSAITRSARTLTSSSVGTALRRP